MVDCDGRVGEAGSDVNRFDVSGALRGVVGVEWHFWQDAVCAEVVDQAATGSSTGSPLL